MSTSPNKSLATGLIFPSLVLRTVHWSTGHSRCALTRMLNLISCPWHSGRPPHNALTRLDKSRVVSFIRNYVTIYTLPDPGCLQGTIRDFVLESGKTMKSVYWKAMESLSRSTPAPLQPCPYPTDLSSGLKWQYTLLNVPPASPTRFAARAVKYLSIVRLWRKYYINVKIQPSRSDLYDKCDQVLVLLQHSLSDVKCKGLIKQLSTANISSRPGHFMTSEAEK